MNLSTNINHNGKDIVIAANNAVNPHEIKIKVFAGDGLCVQDLSMYVPITSAKRVTKKYLRICGIRLIEAQVCDF